MTSILSKIEVDTRPPPPEVMEIAERELRETPERVKEATNALRELLKGEPTLYYRDDEDVLIKFLRPTKFYPESALALMKRVAEFKQKNSAILDNLMPADEERALLEHRVVNVLADRDQKGRRILITHNGSLWDPSQVSSDQIFRIFYIIHQAALKEPISQICGTVVIMDFDGLGMKQVRGLSPAFSLRLLTFIQDAMPLRLKEVHIVNQPFIFNMVWQMFKPFIREKLKKRMFFHGRKMESLHEHIDPEYLPENYGGKLPKINYSSVDWYPVLRTLDDTFKEWNSFGYKK
ncbi:retinaldehyde-binding protein 1 [Periplaneta americana]|uniref:retinaldehyde-binding protein 1 n=1 Tax=Periplaneta americana TaxID=6978 RepID=UPI0037E8898D